MMLSNKSNSTHIIYILSQILQVLYQRLFLNLNFNATVDAISGGDYCFEIIWQTLNYPKNIPMKHRTQKDIENPIKMHGMSFNISFVLSNAPLNERLS